MWVSPPPSAPSRFAAGTRQSSKISSDIVEPRMPSLSMWLLVEKPGQSRSTTKAVMRPSTLA